MYLRYLGAVFIFVSCGAFGFLFAANFRQEERCLLEIVRLLDGMQNELEYRLTPLPQICQKAAEGASGCLHRVFAALAQELESQIAPDASACMENALLSVKDVPVRCRKALAALGNSLGKFDLQGQVNEICAVREQCQAELAQMQDQKDIRLRSYRTLGLCVGAGLAILFL